MAASSDGCTPAGCLGLLALGLFVYGAIAWGVDYTLALLLKLGCGLGLLAVLGGLLKGR